MKKTFISLCFCGLSVFTLHAQTGLFGATAGARTNGFVYGIRAGLNVATATNGASLGTTPKLGFMVGLHADNSYGRITGMRQEITYSRQGFHFKHADRSGQVDLHYLMVGNLFTLNIGNILQAHIGPQVGYLANATADTINHLNGSNVASFFSVKNDTRRFVYGGCAGLEIYPYKGLLVGARYNLGFSAIGRQKSNTVYTAAYDQNTSRSRENRELRNVVWQFVVGWRFGHGVNAK